MIRGTEAVLEDLVSTNGTFVNGERLDAPYVLRAGDKVELGGCTLEFVPATPPAPTRTGSDGEGTLKIISGPGAGESTTLHGSATIGRDEGTDLRVQRPRGLPAPRQGHGAGRQRLDRRPQFAERHVRQRRARD